MDCAWKKKVWCVRRDKIHFKLTQKFNQLIEPVVDTHSCWTNCFLHFKPLSSVSQISLKAALTCSPLGHTIWSTSCVNLPCSFSWKFLILVLVVFTFLVSRIICKIDSKIRLIKMWLSLTFGSIVMSLYRVESEYLQYFN